MIYAFLAMQVFLVVAAYFAGRYVERRSWNGLIEDGIIPRPGGRS